MSKRVQSIWFFYAGLFVLVGVTIGISVLRFRVRRVQRTQDESWSYHGKTGPEHWDELKPQFKICKTGKLQSPINIPTRRVKVDSHLKVGFHYKKFPLHLTNNGHTIQVNAKQGGHVDYDGHKYHLKQFHFHTPCEHKIDGKSYAGELHLVHQDTKKHLLVVSFLLDDRQKYQHPFFAQMINKVPKTKNTVFDAHTTINLEDIVPKQPHFFTYTGSLTTPRCTEGVRWIVMDSPLSLSKSQIDALHDVMHDNARPIQSLYSRQVLTDHEESERK